LNNEWREMRECGRCIGTISRRSVVEDYRNGNLTLILDVKALLDGNVKRRLPHDAHVADSHNFPSVILQLNSAKNGELEGGYQESVFVQSIETVKGPEGLIPSVVRLYFGKHQIEKCRGD